MKKKLITLIILLAIFLAKVSVAQPYLPMAVDSARWIVLLNYQETPIPVDDLWEYYANGDTLVGGTFYMKIYKRDLEVTQLGPPFTPISEYELSALMRDDIAEKKVYVMPIAENSYSSCELGVESLVYDFSLAVGDTISSCLSIGYSNLNYIEYIKEDSTFGLLTRRFGIGDVGYFYEGIGSSYGLLEDMFAPVKNADQNLFRLSLAYYCRKVPCGYVVSAPNQPIPSNFSIYPNPANKGINIQLPQNTPPSSTKVEVYSADGRLVHKAIPGNNPYVFNTDNLVSGLYLIRLWDGKVWQTGKVVRE